MINHFKRYQVGLTLNDLYPKIDGYCACGCNRPLLKPSRKWFSTECRTKAYLNFAVIKGDNFVIREQLFLRDNGACRCCGEITATWEADHIIPVYMGGGGLGLDNFQTLCEYCHNKKTYKVGQRKAISSQAASTLFITALHEPVEGISFPVKRSNEMQSLGFATSPVFNM